MKPQELIIRCFSEQKDGVWQAFCLNFDLAVQGDSADDVHRKITDMIHDYVIDALSEDGEDREYAAQLLTRKAPFSLWARYYWIAALCKLHAFRNGLCNTFNTVMPMEPIQRA